ncbi:hypothetical protein GCM10018785_29380 [Streptomyces longispororuber]|uniref:Uncharacterized protein n=2 Tax=Streptomyces longispororuber TaxID=68230 RepID=A0A919DN04_9ACTN|nr:hypothetical protein GCM10018785_29380 [Streptomyces longispororuber]
MVYDAAKGSVGRVVDAEGPFVQLRSRDGLAWDAERRNLSPAVSVSDLAVAERIDLSAFELWGQT